MSGLRFAAGLAIVALAGSMVACVTAVPIGPSQPSFRVVLATPAVGAASVAPAGSGASEFDVEIDGRIVNLGTEYEEYDSRDLPDSDAGTELATFRREGTVDIESLDTPSRGGIRTQSEFALASGNWVSAQEVGVIQLVTNFGMWKHVPLGPRSALQFPTHLAELERDAAGWDYVWYVDVDLLPAEFISESIPNQFLSHPNLGLRTIRVGQVRVRLEDADRTMVGEVDVIGRVAYPVVLPPTDEELSYYRYQATFTGQSVP